MEKLTLNKNSFLINGVFSDASNRFYLLHDVQNHCIELKKDKK